VNAFVLERQQDFSVLRQHLDPDTVSREAALEGD
jgi:hypothetical protein